MILDLFFMISAMFLEMIFAVPRTANDRNEQARTARNLQKPRQRNRIASIGRFAKRQQQQQTHAPKRRATKMGAGGARAARRIRIRRPPLSGASRRVRPHSQFCRLQKPLPHPALPADPRTMYPFFRPVRLKRRFFVDFLPIENSSKI